MIDPMVLCERTYRKIIPVAGGKGGVGKSVMAANLGLLLGEAGRRTVLVDLDVGGSNLHSCLGLKNTNLGLGNFVSRKDTTFQDIMLRTDYSNLFFIPGDVLVAGTPEKVQAQKRSIIAQLLKIEADYIILDLGSGSGALVVDFFLISNAGLLVVTPQATSVLNAYGFLKNTVFRFLQLELANKKAASTLLAETLREARPNALPPMAKIIKSIEARDKASGARVREFLKSLKPGLVVNMAETPEDLRIIENLQDLVKKNLGVDLSCLGLVYRDEEVNASMRELRPLVLGRPDSLAARQINRVAQKILQSRDFPDMPLDLSLYRDSFELAAIEAENDYSRKAAAPAAEKSDAIAPDEMLAVLSAQQKKISELQGTIRMLTMGGQGGPLMGRF